ncbi:uncharacterized protein LOC124168922 [Ischnura elegans]|uniref:uncharacterized protein LOC124168922 n=1 Tax=Ischnura elegans TaxID=197161 RepID=UPI001ED86F1E|nr:uncharacterized protein LOC124168922 [Ischnura elegans]
MAMEGKHRIEVFHIDKNTRRHYQQRRGARYFRRYFLKGNWIPRRLILVLLIFALLAFLLSKGSPLENEEADLKSNNEQTRMKVQDIPSAMVHEEEVITDVTGNKNGDRTTNDFEEYIRNNANNYEFIDPVTKIGIPPPPAEEAVPFESKQCKIPLIDPWDEAILPFVKRPEPFSCGPPPPMTRLIPSCATAEAKEATDVLCTETKSQLDWPPPTPLVVINSSIAVEWASVFLSEMKCCAAPISRDEPRSEKDLGTDNRIRIGKCIPFNDTISTTSDFTVVNCSQDDQSMYIGMHAHVVPTEETLKKVEAAAAKGANRPPSIFLLAIDSSSRLNFFRAMPKLRAVLEEAGAVDMTSYNKVGENTLPNLVPLLGGLSLEEASGEFSFTEKPIGFGCWPNSSKTFDDCPFLFKAFSRSGYVTMFAEDEPKQSTFNYFKPGFRYQPTDHYLRPFFVFGGEHAKVVRRETANWCHAQTPTHLMMMDYVKSFVETYSPRVPFFSFTFFVGIGHTSAPDIELADENIAEFARWVIASADEDTKKGGSGLFFAAFSDHGMRWGPLRQSPAGWMEERLPFLYIRPPLTKEALARRTASGDADFPELVKSLYPHLLRNKDRLITPYDLHHTLASFLNNRAGIPNCAKCFDILQDTVPLSRTCKDAKIPDKYCTCVDEYEGSVKTTRVKNASRAAVEYLNGILEGQPQCSRLSLDKILSASYRVIPSINGDNEIRMLAVKIATHPGGAVFEVDTIINKLDVKIQPFPTRLNIYGNQSWCTGDWKLKPYCYCP